MRGDLVDFVTFCVVETDADGRIVDTNGVFDEWAGIPTVGLLFDDLVTSAAHLAMPGLKRLRRADGSSRPVFAEKTSGRQGHFLYTVTDASAQERYAEELIGEYALTQRTQTRLELVISSSIAFAAAETERDLAEVLVDTTMKAYAAEEATVYLLDEHNVFHQVAGTNPFEPDGETASLADEARALREVVKISGVEQARALAPSVGAAFEATGVQAMIVAPIYQRTELLGILGAFFHHPRQFDEQASPLAYALAGQAARAIANLRLRAELEHAATHDRTTGLANRRLLEEHLELRPQHAASILAVLFIDLDGFKEINDRLGHHTGDVLLREVGRRLQHGLRDQDIVARYGGDEFVVVCEVADESTAARLAERLRDSIAAPYSFLDVSLSVGASVGLTVAPADVGPAAVDRLIREADQAMYRAKLSGGNRVVAAAIVG